MSSPPDAARLMAKHAAMPPRIAQWMVNLGKLPRRDFEEACSLGKVALAEAAHRYDPAKGSETTYFWLRIYGAIRTGLARERAYRRRMWHAGLVAAEEYLSGRRPVEDPAALSAERALAELRGAAGGITTALALGHLGGVWNLDAESQVAAREEHAHALKALQVELSGLPERDQRLLAQHYTEGIPWEKVAAGFAVSKSTIERWHAEAIGRLARRLRKRDVHGSPPRLDTG